MGTRVRPTSGTPSALSGRKPHQGEADCAGAVSASPGNSARAAACSATMRSARTRVSCAPSSAKPEIRRRAPSGVTQLCDSPSSTGMRGSVAPTGAVQVSEKPRTGHTGSRKPALRASATLA